MIRRFSILFCLMFLLSGIPVPFILLAQTGNWLPIPVEMSAGLKGFVPVRTYSDTLTLITLHEVSSTGECQVGIASILPELIVTYAPIPWPENAENPRLPVSLCSFPETYRPTYMLMTESGAGIHFDVSLNDTTMEILEGLHLSPTRTPLHVQSFAIQRNGGDILGVWAQSGTVDSMITIRWGLFNPTTYQVSRLGFAPVQIPADSDTRGFRISELRVDDTGLLFALVHDPTRAPVGGNLCLFGLFQYENSRSIYVGKRHFLRLHDLQGPAIEAFDFTTGATSTVIYGAEAPEFGGLLFVE